MQSRHRVTDVVVDVLLVRFGLKLVGHCEHDHVGPSRSFRDAHDLQAFAFGFCTEGGAFAQMPQQRSLHRNRAGSTRGRGLANRSPKWPRSCL